MHPVIFRETTKKEEALHGGALRFSKVLLAESLRKTFISVSVQK